MGCVNHFADFPHIGVDFRFQIHHFNVKFSNLQQLGGIFAYGLGHILGCTGSILDRSS